MTTDDAGDVVELGPLWHKLRRGAPLIAATTVLLLGIALLYTFLVAPRWEAGAVLFVPDSSNIPISSTLMTQMVTGSGSGAGAAAAAALGIGQKSDPLSILEGLLESRTTTGSIATQLGVKRDKLEALLSHKVDKDSSQLKINYENGDPAFAIRAVRTAVNTLQRTARAAYSDRPKRLVAQLERQLKKVQAGLGSTEAKILALQANMQTSPAPPNPGDTVLLSGYGAKLQEVEAELKGKKKELAVARDMARAIGGKAARLPTGLPATDAWRKRMLDLEFELHKAEITGGPEAPRVVALRRERDIARRQLETEISNYMESVDTYVHRDVARLAAETMVLEWRAGYLRDLQRKAPMELEELQKLLRQQSIQTAILVNVKTEFTKASMEAVIAGNDPLKFVVLDEAGLNDDRPVNKRWGRNSAIGLMLGLLLGCFAAIRRPLPEAPRPRAGAEDRRRETPAARA